MAALIIAIFPQNSSRGNWEEQQDRTDPNSRFELARKPAWLLAFRQFGLPKWKHDFECGPFNHLGTSPYSSCCLDNCEHSVSVSLAPCSPGCPQILTGRGFVAFHPPRRRSDFESALLWPLRYCCKISLFIMP